MVLYLLIISFYLFWRVYHFLQEWKANQKIKEEIKKIRREVNTPSYTKEEIEKYDKNINNNDFQREFPQDFSLLDDSNWELFRIAFQLKNFTSKEVVEKSELPSSKIKLWLNAMTYFGAVEVVKYGEGERKKAFYSVSKPRIEKLCKRIVSFIESSSREINASKEPSEISLSQFEIKALLTMGVRTISFICFDDQIGPVIKYKVLDSSFIERMGNNPGKLGKLITTLSLDVKEMTLLDGVQILCKKIGHLEEEGQRFIILEKIEKDVGRDVQHFLEDLGRFLKGKQLEKKTIHDALSRFL